jgi:hypothetical protein
MAPQVAGTAKTMEIQSYKACSRIMAAFQDKLLGNKGIYQFWCRLCGICGLVLTARSIGIWADDYRLALGTIV